MARDRRLAAAADPRRGVLRRPPRARRRRRPVPPHPAAHPAGRRGPRRRHGRGRLHLRLRARLPARLHIGDPHLDAARLHGALRVPRRAAAADARVRERRGAPHGGRHRSGPARLLRPATRGHQGTVLVGLRPDARRRRALRSGAAAGRARVPARRGRGARRVVRAGYGDAAGHGVLRHRVLHRWHGCEQGFPGDPKGGEALRAGGGQILHGASVGGRAVAVLLPGSRGGHLLRAHAAGGHPHRGVHPGHGGGRRDLPAREIQQREGRGAGALALGPRVLLLRGVERGQGQEKGGGRRGGAGVVICVLYLWTIMRDGGSDIFPPLYSLYVYAVVVAVWMEESRVSRHLQ